MQIYIDASFDLRLITNILSIKLAVAFVVGFIGFFEATQGTDKLGVLLKGGANMLLLNLK